MPGTIGNTEHCENVTQNSYNNYSLVGKLKREPRNVRVHAIRNYSTLYYVSAIAISLLLMFFMTYIVYYLDGKFLDKQIVRLIILSSSVIIGVLSSIFFLEKLFKKAKWGYVLYKNKTIVYKLKREKFYDDIWDIELKKTWQGNGRLRYYGVTKETDKPYYREITLMNYAQAKYIYDSFWSNEKEG